LDKSNVCHRSRIAIKMSRSSDKTRAIPTSSRGESVSTSDEEEEEEESEEEEMREETPDLYRNSSLGMCVSISSAFVCMR
jgi:E3 ubiquitin-protein ligase HUWE1